jgi:hypothetical protein
MIRAIGTASRMLASTASIEAATSASFVDRAKAIYAPTSSSSGPR